VTTRLTQRAKAKDKSEGQKRKAKAKDKSEKQKRRTKAKSKSEGHPFLKTKIPAAQKPLAFPCFSVKSGQNPSQNKSKVNALSRMRGIKNNPMTS
jgi:hypothetical protein